MPGNQNQPPPETPLETIPPRNSDLLPFGGAGSLGYDLFQAQRTSGDQAETRLTQNENL